MQKIKKIFFTLFLIIVSISAVNAKDTLLTCEYYKPYDESLKLKDMVGVMCEIYNDYSHKCFVNVGESFATPRHNEEKIENWGYTIGGKFPQIKDFVQENNKCPNYLLLKLDIGINGYEVYAANSLEDLNYMKSELSGTRYQATLKGFGTDEEKQNVADTIVRYTETINNTINNYSIDKCQNQNNTEDPYINCKNLVSDLENQINEWNKNVNDWINRGLINENALIVWDYKGAAEKLEDFKSRVYNDIVQNSHPPIDKEPPKDNYDPAKIENFCQEKGVLKSLRFLGYLLLVVKIVIPILLIIFGTLDFSKALMSSDNDAMQKSTKSLVTRVIAGIIIFFIPTIVNFVFTLAKSDNSSFENCRTCIFKPSDCEID